MGIALASTAVFFCRIRDTDQWADFMAERRFLIRWLLILALTLFAGPAQAQLSGHNSKGDFGLLSGSQAPPGWYLVAPMYYRYSADEFRDRNGDNLLAIASGGSVEATAWLAGAMWVSEHKIFGGNYSFSIWPGVTDNALEFPPLGLDEGTSTGLADLYIQPINLGWNTPRADFIAGLGIFAPTGDYEAGGDNNRGLGMWSYELFGGTTIYFDEARTWHFAATAFYETHGKKDGTDVRVGDLLTVEGGPRQVLHGWRRQRRYRLLRPMETERRRFRHRSARVAEPPPRQASCLRLRPRSDAAAGHQANPVRFPEPALLLGNRRPHFVAGQYFRGDADLPLTGYPVAMTTFRKKVSMKEMR